jgi:hypothetical protein
MLASYYPRQLVLISTRAALSTLPYPKSSETQATPDGKPINYPTSKTKIEHGEPIPLNDVLDAKASKTLILPGVPLTPTPPALANESQRVTKEVEHERIPSSRFSAFLRSIQSGLPFFPSKKNLGSSIDIATTREHFLPVEIILFFVHTKKFILLCLVNTSFINSFISY